jgi:hypothetical protein
MECSSRRPHTGYLPNLGYTQVSIGRRSSRPNEKVFGHALVELPALNLDDRAFIDLPCMNNIEHTTNAHQANKQHACPVEIDRCDIHAVWPETPEEGPDGVHEGHDIDWEAPPAECPARVWQWLVAQAFEGHATDGDDIGSHERDGGEREHGVEGHSASNVDQGQDNREGAGEDDAVHGDVPGFVDLGGAGVSMHDT